MSTKHILIIYYFDVMQIDDEFNRRMWGKGVFFGVGENIISFLVFSLHIRKPRSWVDMFDILFIFQVLHLYTLFDAGDNWKAAFHLIGLLFLPSGNLSLLFSLI